MAAQPEGCPLNQCLEERFASRMGRQPLNGPPAKSCNACHCQGQVLRMESRSLPGAGCHLYKVLSGCHTSSSEAGAGLSHRRELVLVFPVEGVLVHPKQPWERNTKLSAQLGVVRQEETGV